MADYYIVTDLGILPGGVSSTAAAISDRGHVVGTSGVAGGRNHAFLWTPGTGMQDLGVVAGNNSDGGGISQCDAVVGHSDFAGGGSNTHAFVWTLAGGMQDIGTLPGDNSSAAVAVNSCGQVVGNSVLTAGGHLRGFIWTRAAGMLALGVLPGFTDTGVHGINSGGRVVGYCAAAGAQNRGFVWSPAVMLSVRPLPGSLASDAVGINDLGDVAGSSVLGNQPRAVLWNRIGNPRDLGLLPGGRWSTAFAVNVFKTVVGNAECSVQHSHAFVWNAQDGIRDLNALIPANPVWELQGAMGINIFGQIVGVGTLNAQQHAFLLTPQCIP